MKTTLKNKKKQEEAENNTSFSISFINTVRWITAAGNISFEKVPLVLALSQLLWCGKIDTNQIPSASVLRKWEEVFGKVDLTRLSSSLAKQPVNIASDLSKRNGEEVYLFCEVTSDFEKGVVCDHELLESTPESTRAETCVPESYSKHHCTRNSKRACQEVNSLSFLCETSI